MPRAGIISVSTKASLIPTGNQDGLYVGGSYLNGAEVAVSADYLNTYGGSVSLNASETHLAVQAGDVLSLLIGTGLPTNGGTVIYSNLAYQYEV
jgi:hypothetical protein